MSDPHLGNEEHSTTGAYVHEGEEFDRDTTYVEDRVVDDPAAREGDPPRTGRWPVEAGRYRLVAARACPWANRAIIVRRLLGLEGAISMGVCGPTHDARSWTFDLDEGGRDPVLGYERLQQAFFARFPEYPRGITVPALVDVPSGALVTNDYPQMTLDLSTQWTAHHREGAWELYPPALRDQIDEMALANFHDVNNGVYKCGFAGSQQAYEKAYDALFARLDVLEEHLSTRRFLVGDTITEADVRLFTTLARFDAVYHGHFKANRNTLSQMPALWGYARDLFQTPGFGDTIDFHDIKAHYYVVQTDLNPTRIVPKGPDLTGWTTAHHREDLGGRPFGGGTAPGPVAAGEEVPQGHGPLVAVPASA